MTPNPSNPMSIIDSSSNFTSILTENRVFKPASGFAADSHVGSMAEYKRLYPTGKVETWRVTLQIAMFAFLALAAISLGFLR